MIFSAGRSLQFRALVRLFASRFIDPELIQAREDLSSLFSQAAALLAAVSLVVCFIVVQAYVRGNPPAAARWTHAEFLISTTMAVIGVFTLLLWDSLFPDRRDSLILGVLPIRTRTVFGAKVAALGSALCCAVLAVNSFTGLVFPLFILPGGQDSVGIARCLGSYWIVMGLASVFTFFTLLSLQGIAVQVLRPASFQRWSGIIQCVAFFAVLTVYFLAPPLATPDALADPGNARWFAVLPSYWFLGLFQVLNGSSDALFGELARRAVLGVAAVTVLGGACYLLVYARQVGRAIEQQGIAPRRSETLRRLAGWWLRLICPSPEEQALLSFAGRTLARSRQHRSLIAIYAGLGLAYIFSGIAGVIYSPHSYAAAERSRAALGIPLLVLFFLIAGIRVSFSIPTEVRANWLFRLTDPFGSGCYFTAARKTLLVFAVAPVLAISAVVYGAFWPWRQTVAHLGFIAAVGLLLVEWVLRKWDKIPFTCTYLPGSANLKVMFGVYCLLLWALSEMVIRIESEALQAPAGYAVLMVLTLFAWRYAARQGADARAVIAGLRFEETPESGVTSLGIVASEVRAATATSRVARPAKPSMGPRLSILAPPAIQTLEPDASVGGSGSLRTWGQDVRYALRMWRKAPGFTAVAVIVLATGIGANAVVFTMTNAIIFKNLPFKNSDRILYLQGTPRVQTFSYPDFLDLRAQVRSFQGLAAYDYANASVSDQAGPPERHRSMRMSVNGLSVMEQSPIVGRGFLPEDELPGAAPVAMLTYDLWRTRYGGDPAVVGKTIRIDEVPTTVVGVTPKGVRFVGDNDLWTPLVRTEDSGRRDRRHLGIFGMIAGGATRKSANAEIETIMKRLALAYPATNQGYGARVITLRESHLPNRTTNLFAALMGAVAFVLLIACANVANLLLARAVGRSREISIRAALGASRARVIRQLLTESALLAIAGGALGCALAVWGARPFAAGLARLGANVDFSMDNSVLVYLGAISLASAILFGLAPALRASKTDLQSALKDGGSGIGTRSRGLSSLIVSAEVAVAVVLLAGAGVMIRSILNIARSSIGVETANVLTMRVELPGATYGTPDDAIWFYGRLKASLEVLPGVESVAVASDLPGNGWERDFVEFPYEAQGAAPANDRQRPRTAATVVGPGYFRVMRVRPVLGREFTDSDGLAGEPVVVVNQSLARKAWPHGNPVGRRIRVEGSANGGAWQTVVGVAPDILQNDFSRGEPRLYLPFGEAPQSSAFVAARTRVPPATLGAAFRHAVQDLDSDLPVQELRSLDEHVALHHLDVRMFTVIFGIFAGVALLLAAIGLSTVVAHSVSQRTHELGVRMALGASSIRIFGLVLARGMGQLAAGLTVGILLALSVTRVLGTLLVDIQPDDPLTLLLTAAVLAAAGILGCAIPARRALRVDPMTALRSD